MATLAGLALGCVEEGTAPVALSALGGDGAPCGGSPPPSYGLPCNACGGTFQCDGSCPRPAAPFKTPERHPLSSTGRDDSIELGGGGLFAFIASDRRGGRGGTDIYISTRSSIADDFGPPTLLPAVNTDAYERSPRLSTDLLRLYVESDRSADAELYVARRPDPASPFGNAAPLGPPGEPGADDTDPFLTPDELTIYFASNRALGKPGSRDLYQASRASIADRFGPASLVADLSSPQDDTSPLLTKDELVIYFASSRAGSDTHLDVYRATRASKSVPFGAPVPVAELNTLADEYPTWISPDECEIYLSSDRSTAGDRDLYRAVRRSAW